MYNKIRIFGIVICLFLLSFSFINILSKDKMSNNTSKNLKAKVSLNEKEKVSITLNESSMDDSSKLPLIPDKAIKDDKNVRPITFAWPCKGNIVINFSPSELVYDPVLEQYHTTNGVTLKTQNTELNSMCDGKITSIKITDNNETEIEVLTTENHKITISGYFKNLIKKEGDILLKGNKLGDIILSGEYAYITIYAMQDNNYINPTDLIK